MYNPLNLYMDGRNGTQVHKEMTKYQISPSHTSVEPPREAGEGHGRTKADDGNDLIICVGRLLS